MKKWFLALTLLTTLNSFAGNGSSGGGGSAVCRDLSGKIVSSTLLDLYEAPYIHGLEIDLADNLYKDQVQLRLQKIKRIPFYFHLINEAVAEIYKSFNFLPIGVSLNAPLDSGENDAVLVPEGCRLEGVGFYNSNGILRVSKSTFDSFNETNKAAFILHEALYFLYRSFHPFVSPMTSYDARKMNAMFFANKVTREEVINFFRDYINYQPFNESGDGQVVQAVIPSSVQKKNFFRIKVDPKKDNKKSYTLRVGCTGYDLNSVNFISTITVDAASYQSQEIEIEDKGCHGLRISDKDYKEISGINLNVFHNDIKIFSLLNTRLKTRIQLAREQNL